MTVRIGLVLGAGGTPGGFFLRAAMAALTERTGFEPAMSSTVIGTSAGALNAARIAPDPRPADASHLHRLTELAEECGPPARTLSDRIIAGPRRLLGRAVGRLVPEGTNSPQYPVAAPPYHPGVRAVSCRRSDGTRRITSLAQAVDPAAELYASAAIPGFAPPVVLDGAPHVDGAVWSTTNADLISPRAFDAMVVIAPMAPRTGGSIVQRGHRASLLAEIAPWLAAGKPVVVVMPTLPALENRRDHEAFAADARSQVLKP